MFIWHNQVTCPPGCLQAFIKILVGQVYVYGTNTLGGYKSSQNSPE
jgi:hypothetical protein